MSSATSHDADKTAQHAKQMCDDVSEILDSWKQDRIDETEDETDGPLVPRRRRRMKSAGSNSQDSSADANFTMPGEMPDTGSASSESELEDDDADWSAEFNSVLADEEFNGAFEIYCRAIEVEQAHKELERAKEQLDASRLAFQEAYVKPRGYPSRTHARPRLAPICPKLDLGKALTIQQKVLEQNSRQNSSSCSKKACKVKQSPKGKSGDEQGFFEWVFGGFFGNTVCCGGRNYAVDTNTAMTDPAAVALTHSSIDVAAPAFC